MVKLRSQDRRGAGKAKQGEGWVTSPWPHHHTEQNTLSSWAALWRVGALEAVGTFFVKIAILKSAHAFSRVRGSSSLTHCGQSVIVMCRGFSSCHLPLLSMKGCTQTSGLISISMVPGLHARLQTCNGSTPSPSTNFSLPCLSTWLLHIAVVLGPCTQWVLTSVAAADSVYSRLQGTIAPAGPQADPGCQRLCKWIRMQVRVVPLSVTCRPANGRAA